VGGITFNEPLTEDQVRTLIGVLSSDPEPPQRRTALLRRLSNAGLLSIELHPQYRFLTEDEEINKDFGQVYLSCAEVVAEALANMGANRLPNPLPVRRVIHDILDVTHSKVQGAAGVAWELDAELPAFARHTLMVTNLSLIIGRAARLSEVSIADLGMAAMYHDIGLCSEEAEYAKHSHAGLGVMLRQRGFHAARIRRMLAVLEHHKRFDDPVTPSLFARIIHIADDYDILTRPRPGKGPVYAPPDAMRVMAAQSGTAYEPELLQIFVNCLGPYPPGSMLRLADGRVVVSISGVRSPQTFGRPLCRVELLADGSMPEDEQRLDLAQGGRIVDVIRPQTIAGAGGPR
jgi:HD-GYP domain-containing protein (c-di-GMP phosphodiesterase class II)